MNEMHYIPLPKKKQPVDWFFWYGIGLVLFVVCATVWFALSFSV